MVAGRPRIGAINDRRSATLSILARRCRRRGLNLAVTHAGREPRYCRASHGPEDRSVPRTPGYRRHPRPIPSQAAQPEQLHGQRRGDRAGGLGGAAMQPTMTSWPRVRLGPSTNSEQFRSATRPGLRLQVVSRSPDVYLGCTPGGQSQPAPYRSAVGRGREVAHFSTRANRPGSRTRMINDRP